MNIGPLLLVIGFFSMFGLGADEPIQVNRIVALVNGKPITTKRLGQQSERAIRQFWEANGNRRNDPKLMAGARRIVRDNLKDLIREIVIEDHLSRFGDAERDRWLKNFQAKSEAQKSEVYEELLENEAVQIRDPRLAQPDPNKKNQQGQQGGDGDA